MINDQTYQIEEAKINDLFVKAGWFVELQSSSERIERIADRAMFENIGKETTSFIFVSFGSAIHGLVGASFGSIIVRENTNYKA